MKQIIQAILILLLGTLILTLFLFGFDMELARQEYNYKLENNIREPLTTCIFEHTCKHYNQLLKENIL